MVMRGFGPCVPLPVRAGLHGLVLKGVMADAPCPLPLELLAHRCCQGALRVCVFSWTLLLHMWSANTLCLSALDTGCPFYLGVCENGTSLCAALLKVAVGSTSVCT